MYLLDCTCMKQEVKKAKTVTTAGMLHERTSLMNPRSFIHSLNQINVQKRQTFLVASKISRQVGWAIDF